jgi:hypothetical protein
MFRDKRFDVMYGTRFPQRIAQNLTQTELDVFLKARGLVAKNERPIGLILHEVQAVEA